MEIDHRKNMKKSILILLSILMSCSQLIDPPKNLIAKDKMSQIVAEFAMNDQINTYIPGTSVENATRMALKEKDLKPTDFTESFKYYTATGELEEILNNAQQIILQKDPAAKVYIEKRLKETQNVPPFAR